MPANPRASVVVTCYNLGRFLPEAIDSVRRQTFSDFEIVVVDDGSTEPETADALRRVSGPDLRVVRTENRGLPAARNVGISLARGEYISCLDADDAFEPAWLELSVARLDSDPGVGFVSHWLELFGDETCQWTPERTDLAALIDQNVFNGAALFRRELVEILGGFDESMRNGCEDWEFWIRVMTAGYRGATIPAVLHRYRRRPDSMSRRMRTGDTWLQVYGGLLNKYPEARAEHLLDMLLRREWTIGKLCRAIDSVRQELSLNLEPALDQRKRELETARARQATEPPVDDTGAPLERTTDVDAATHDHDEELAGLRSQVFTLAEAYRALEQEREAARQHVEALHRSWSWRITAPGRRLYELLYLGRSPAAQARDGR
jgi:glycosyltransferase involved in cell wall biosynthesis